MDPDVDLRVPAQRAEASGRGAWRVLAAVAAGGAAGAAARYGLTSAWPVPGGGFPWPVLVVNVTGCALIGVLMVLVSEGPAIPARAAGAPTADAPRSRVRKSRVRTSRVRERGVREGRVPKRDARDRDARDRDVRNREVRDRGVRDRGRESGVPEGRVPGHRAREVPEGRVPADGCAARGGRAGAGPHPLWRPFLGTGVLGGYTTFSTYAVDIRTLLVDGAPGTAAAYAAGTLFAALAAVWAAVLLTRGAVRRYEAGAARRPAVPEAR
ncbi:CrcB family protein [Streptomyces lycii]|uniref:Fluoride-specific ion channel FluC n=1 Tax=Streptomyces lycii TaxID=2654337 RepID=A0ABQ7F943_9ACTN|nr:CrcB family protein [Streptomyces lycii]